MAQLVVLLTSIHMLGDVLEDKLLTLPCCYSNRIVTRTCIQTAGSAAPVCVLVVLEVLMAVVQSICRISYGRYAADVYTYYF